jgi:hypothetical protein
MRLHHITFMGSILILSACKPSFSDEDINNVKAAIRTEFGKTPGISVKEVQIIKESDQRLTGFVKLEAAGFEVMKDCSANMGADHQYIWKCE